MPYIVNLYEREGKKFWGAGQFVFDTRKRAIACLEHQVCEGICGLVHNKSVVFAFRGMSEHEALHRIVGMQFLAVA